MALPVLEAARGHWPDARLVVSGRPQLAPILGAVSDVFVPHPKGLGLRGLAGVARSLGEAGADLALVLPRSFETALCARAAGIDRRFGIRGQGRSWLLTDPVDGHPGVPRGELQGRAPARAAATQDGWWQVLAAASGRAAPGREDPVRCPRWAPDSDAGAEAARWRESHGVARPWAVLAPGAAFGPSKLWTPQGWAVVAEGLRVRGLEPVLVLGPGEAALGEEIARAAGDPLPVATLGIGGLAALIQGASVFAGTDAGPRWLAAAVDTPAVCLMGPNDPRLTDLPIRSPHEVLRRPMACSPCLAKHCPEGHHECMAGIAAEDVLAAVDRVRATHAPGPQ